MVLISSASFFSQQVAVTVIRVHAQVEGLLRPEGGHVLFGDAGDIGRADAVPSGVAAFGGGHHPAVAAGLVVAQGAHVLLADLHLEVGVHRHELPSLNFSWPPCAMAGLSWTRCPASIPAI